MAKTSTAETLSPAAVSVGAIAAARAGRRAANLLNYVAGHRPTVHIACGPSVLVGVQRPPVALFFPIVLGSTNPVRTRVRIKVDTQTVTIGARCLFNTPGDSGRVNVAMNVGTSSILADDSLNAVEQLDTIATSLSGTGWVDFFLSLERVSGSGIAYLSHLSVQDTPILLASAFPDPAND